MAGTYDLTEKIAPFLDSQQLRKLKEFNGESAEPLKTAPSSTTPSLTTARELYDAGRFKESSEMLDSLRSQIDQQSADYVTLMWGKLAADLLLAPESVETPASSAEASTEDEPTPAATEEIKDPVLRQLSAVQELLDQRRTGDSTQQLNRRAWLIHWSLFAYYPGRLSHLVDTFFASQYMSVIQAAAPWILRYIVIAVVVTHQPTSRYNRRVKDAIRVVQQELYEYSDPVIEFVQALYIDYDFTNVAAKLDAALNTIKNDFFAHTIVDQFAQSARVLIADPYLRVHEAVPAADLAKTLGIGSDAQKWISSYIANKQEAKLDAAFDEEKGLVRVSYEKPSVYNQVMEKVKSMDQRARQLQQQTRKTEA